MIQPPIVYKITGNKIINGQLIDALIKFSDHYQFVQLRVYADRTIAGEYLFFNMPIEKLYKHTKKFMPKIKKEDLKGSYGCWQDENMNAIPFEDFKYLVNKNFVTLDYKGVVDYYSDALGEIKLPFDLSIKGEDFIKMVEDIFRRLNNEPTMVRIFLNTLCEFLQANKDKKELFRKKLMKAYLEVPANQRPDIYPLTIDMKGTPIEDILYKRPERHDYYDEFVKVYDDLYFEEKYKKLWQKRK